MFRTAAVLPAALALVALAAACASPAPTPNPVPSPTVLPTATPTPTATPALAPTRSPTAPPASNPTPAPTATHAPTASPTQTAAPSPTPASGPYPPGSVIVTFRVDDEEYRILVIDQKNITIARELLNGQEAPPIPNGRVVRGDPSVNVGWSWHIDPASLEFADMTTEVCDGLPSFVEAGTITGDQFCPWSAKVVAVDPANP